MLCHSCCRLKHDGSDSLRTSARANHLGANFSTLVMDPNEPIWQRPALPALRRDGVLQALLGRPTDAEHENHSSGHLLRLLKRPASPVNDDATLVAVSQGGGRAGDIRDKKGGTSIPSGHAQDRSLAKPSTAGEGVLSGPGLRDDDTAAQDDLFGTMDPDLEELETKSTRGVAYKFPPSPPAAKEPSSPQQKCGGPWWKELLASPAKRFRLGHWSQKFQNALMPELKLPPSIEATVETPEARSTQDAATSILEPKEKPDLMSKPSKRRKDLPKRPSAQNMPKPCRRNAVKLATSKMKAVDMVKKVEKDFYANSSRAARASRRKTVENIMRAGELNFPLTPTALKVIVGTLKEAGYKSAQIYLAEAKNMHVEKGFPWNQLLDRNYKLCSAAAKRGAGPRKKAAEVPENRWAQRQLLDVSTPRGGKVNLPGHLFACGVHWMMREIEIAALKSSNVKFDTLNRTVTITWEQSKMDAECRGLARTLQCICSDGCDLRCPYAVLEVLVNNAALKGSKGGHVAFNNQGIVATKAEIVGDWRKLHGEAISGHSTRRSGALQYIRKGWSVSQVAYLGRWKSNVILEYAQEALETMAINAGNTFNKAPTDSEVGPKVRSLSDMLSLSKQVETKVDLAQVQRLKEELDLLKADTKGASEALSSAIKNMEDKMSATSKYLPSLVKSYRHQVIHLNHRTLVFSPSTSWRTACGWYYYLANYQFVEGDASCVTCSKCQMSAQRKEVDRADILSPMDASLADGKIQS